MTDRELKKFSQTLIKINDVCKNIINTIKKYDENVLSFGKHSIYKNDCFDIDCDKNIIKIEYFNWAFNYNEFDYIELSFKEFNGNIDSVCKTYVEKIHTQQMENLRKLRENATKILP